MKTRDFIKRQMKHTVSKPPTKDSLSWDLIDEMEKEEKIEVISGIGVYEGRQSITFLFRQDARKTDYEKL